MKEKFLSEVFSISDFSKEGINLLSKNTGAGKTTLAFNLINSIPNCKALYLIDTTNGKESLLKHNNAIEYSENWRKFVNNTLVSVSEIQNENKPMYFLQNAEKEMEILFSTFDNAPVVMTYQQFGNLLQVYTNFLDFLDIIVLDEAHNLIKYYEMDKGKQRKQLLQSNPHATKEQISMHLKLTSPLYLAVLSLSRVAQSDCYAIAMTATPRKFVEAMEYMQIEAKEIETDASLVAYETLETQFYTNLKQQILKIPANEKAIIFIPNILQMKEMLRYIEAKMPHKGVAIWSIHNTTHPMSSEQLLVREYLKEHKCLPNDVDILIINKSYETGINIVDEEIKQMIIHSREKDIREQIRGRLRLNLPKLYLLEGNSVDELVVPKEYIGVRLFAEEKEKLCEELCVRKSGRMVKWKGIKNILEEQNWIVDEGRTDGRRFSVIRRKITL